MPSYTEAKGRTKQLYETSSKFIKQSFPQSAHLLREEVAAWQKRAGIHCQHIHEEIVQQGRVKSQHIQADEIRAKGRKIIVWMAFAIDVASRLWLVE